MRIITEGEKIVKDLLGSNKASLVTDKSFLRMLKWCSAVSCDDGVILHNYMTGETILLEGEESDCVCLGGKSHDTADKVISVNLMDDKLLEELCLRWFVVRTDNDDVTLIDELRNACKLLNRKKGITSYKIITTTRCNARCFYCYESGIKFADMSEEDVRLATEYIINNCEGKKVTLAWFGGEPTLRADIITTMCQHLRENGIEFSSVMTSNGYLFDEHMADEAWDLWNLRNIQITLDGTRDVYNKVKDYIGIPTSGYTPYDRVINNIKLLTERNIHVNIRMNLGPHNYEDLCNLTDELAEMFGDNNRRISVYVGGLFEELDKDEESKKELVNNIISLSDKLEEKGLASHIQGGLRLRVSSCMADNDRHRGFGPGGAIIKCEHYIYDKTIGSLYESEEDDEAREAWKEVLMPKDICMECPAYPSCYKLKNCPVSHICTESEKREILERDVRTILYEHGKLKDNEIVKEEEETDNNLC